MKEYEIRAVNIMLFSRVECAGERLSHINIYKHDNINQHDNNNLHTPQTKNLLHMISSNIYT